MDFNLLVLLGVAALNAYTAYATRKLHNEVIATRNDVAIIEKATNSMKDALVAATDSAARAEGRAAGLEQGRGEPRE